MNAVIRMENHIIELDGIQYSYQLIRTNSKRLSVRFVDSQFIVRAPWNITTTTIDKFFQTRKNSIIKLMLRDRQRKLVSLQEGNIVTILGQSYVISYGSRPLRHLHQLILRPNHLKQDFLSLLQPLLEEYVKPHYQSYATIMLNQEPPELIYKWLTSRYGQYHTKHHRITLSLMLAFYEKDLIDYVIVHELAHVIVPAHNSEFYRQISIVLPDYRARQRRLRQVGEVHIS